uniref:SWIM-type domain-containing protein n=1 Tax=Lactuca sativa TaxID=4236 RepID=A0A9R1UIB5_LACSA|nr:hypothetical protein LSAT_V11C900490030 [Lactuca sativa]
MSDEEGFQITSLKANHNCARNFKFGSLVITNFGIQVSMGKCRIAKKYELNLIEGSLVEHYAKLWSYGHEILRKNPRSTVKLDMETGLDGKKYFSNFYVCFQGVKQGSMEGCRRIKVLMDIFLKCGFKGELLCVVGRDENDKIYPIDWIMSTSSVLDMFAKICRRDSLVPYIIPCFWKEPKATTKNAFKVLMKGIETLNRRCQSISHGERSKNQKEFRHHHFRGVQIVHDGWGKTDAYEVDLETKTCPCRLWKLYGFGCAYSIASISYLNRDVEAYVCNIIAPINVSDMLPETNYIPPLPPLSRRMPGRLATKMKKSAIDNKGKHEVSKDGKKVKCSSRTEPQQHEEVEMIPIHVDTIQNDMKATPNDVESSSVGDFGQYMQVPPPRIYEGEEGVVGEEPDQFVEGVVGEHVIGVNVQIDEVISNVHVVDNVQIQERIRKTKSERVLKLKLDKTLGGFDDPRNSKGKAFLIDYKSRTQKGTTLGVLSS